MPISKYNPLFGGEKGSAQKALTAMKSKYGEKKGKQVFYALSNKRKQEGK